MALVVSSSSDLKRRSSFPSEQRPWMLKDYLLDDMSSCSSNGFRSFPRHHCCITVRSIIEVEVRNRCSKQYPAKRLLRNRSRASSTAISALRSASMAIINAVRLLPFKSSSIIDAGQKKAKESHLARSLPRKLFKKSHWKKSDSKHCEVERWISSVGENYQPLELSNTTASTAMTASRTSNSTSDGKSNSWSESQFALDYLLSSSENEAVEVKESSPRKKIGERLGDAATEGSMEAAATKEKWGNVEEKEQSSPVSVLDFPDDNEEGISSPFTRCPTHSEGTTQKQMQKLRHFECLSQLEPINLESQMRLFEPEDESAKLSTQSCSTPVHGLGEDDEEHEAEQKAKHLLNLVKAKVSSSNHKFKADNLLIDFFKTNENSENSSLKVAEDWLNGDYDENLLKWEVMEKRQAYIRAMEDGRKWRSLDEEKEVALKLADEVLASLIDELFA
ncbi:hypothetical protein Nepgr_011273 [Nepenthes gracilis]|uniref:DUF4378 domain-containing protein n=1 Tax=Nepenthes gracilis TaxID=150966 RepID=A0AAD3XLU3_NEPGR|nr:hypothetical protein Nepgr_011273 [Nepenthes gracilis]